MVAHDPETAGICCVSECFDRMESRIGTGGTGDMPQLNIYFMNHSQFFYHEVDIP